MGLKLEHANLTVHDIEGMIRFLQTAFPEFRVRAEGTSNDSSRWVHVGTDETYIALSPARTEPAKPWTPYRGLPGVNHLGNEVDDVVGWIQGVHAAQRAPFRKRRYFYDSEGHDWEFVQYLSQNPAERNDYKLPDR